MSSFATAVGAGLLGVLAGVPARAVIQRLAGPPAPAQAGWRWPGVAPAMGLLWFAVTLPLAGQGLGWAVPAYLAFAFVCLVLAVIDAATGLLPNRITYPAFPVVAGLLLAASLGLGELGRLGRGLLAAASVGGLFLPLALLPPHGMGVGGPLTALTLVGRRETRPPEGPREACRLRPFAHRSGSCTHGERDQRLHCGAHAWVSGPMRGSGAMASRSGRCRTTSPSCSPVTAAR